jgi:hypothetical protein
MPFNTSGAVSGAAAGSSFGPWGAAIGGLAGGFLGGGDAQNTPRPVATNYFGMNGSGMYFNPATNGYTSLDPRMGFADQGALFKYKQMMDSLTGGTGSVQASALAEAKRLKEQINDPKTPASMKAELQSRLNQINEVSRTVGDWHNPLGKIGETDPNRQLEFQKQTGTVQEYLKNTLNQQMNTRTLGENTALAARGLGSSSNSQYGAGTRALDYGVASGQNEITANDYLRQLQAGDEAKKYQMFQLAQSGAGGIEGKQLSQEQLALNQMMMGMNFGQAYNASIDGWNRQGAAIDAANKGMDAAGWRDALGAVGGGFANQEDGKPFDWKKFGQGASGVLSGTSPNLWNRVASQPGGSAPAGGGFSWGNAGSWGTQPQINGGFSGFGQPFTGGWNPNQFGSTPSMAWAYNPNKK